MTTLLLACLLLTLTATTTANAARTPTVRQYARTLIVARWNQAEWLAADRRVADRLDRGLARTPLAGLGAVLDEEGRRANVSPYLIAAIAGVESSYGAHPCRSNRRNVWGLASCKSGYGIPYFTGWRQAIRFQAELLRRGWISRGVRDVYTMGRSYCPPCGNGWGAKVAWLMRSLGGTARVTYR